MDSRNEGPKHPIRVVAQRTGLTAAALRAWERRYGAIAPRRSDGGQRYYSDADVERLTLLANAVEAGRRIGAVARLSDEELRALVAEDRRVSTSRSDAEVGAEQTVEDAFDLVERLQAEALRRLLMRSALRLRPHEVVGQLLVPLLRKIGEGWSSGRLGPSSEHLATEVVRGFLEWLSRTIQVDAEAPLLVTATPAGQRHEFGAHLTGVVAAGEGWRVRFLGPDLPSEEIARAAVAMDAACVALSAVHPRLDAAGVRGVLDIRERLPEGIILIVGGAGAEPHRSTWAAAEIRTFPDLPSFREGLREIRRRGPR
jgi:DNA-binding transcriptional MerR regulator/methylmalonyl-CoA mutase cobalamin-binding subunit